MCLQVLCKGEGRSAVSRALGATPAPSNLRDWTPELLCATTTTTTTRDLLSGRLEVQRGGTGRVHKTGAGQLRGRVQVQLGGDRRRLSIKQQFTLPATSDAEGGRLGGPKEGW